MHMTLLYHMSDLSVDDVMRPFVSFFVTTFLSSFEILRSANSEVVFCYDVFIVD